MSEEESFGQLVRACRREIGLTQEELAHRVGCAPITLRKIEHEDLRPSIQIAERLAMALGIPLEERAAFIRLARTERGIEPATPTPAPLAEEIGLEDLSGRAIRGYALGERIGAGGMGVVYRATQPLVEREVALKIIQPQYANQPDFIRRFEAEAQLIARLEHPHIVPLYDYWREPGVAYLVMRLLRGGSVRTRLEKGALPLDMVDRLMEQISQALSAAHRIGVIHRDLKPANILLDEDGNAYLSDFGIAKNLGNLDNLTQVDAIVGSPNYISPEQIRSESIRPQTDIYCLGVMLYELLTGILPFFGPTPVVVMYKHISTPLPPLSPQRPDLPAALDQVIAQATAKDPLDRFPDAEAMLAAWRKALGSFAPGSARVPVPMKPLTDADNPYKGLRAFSEGDAADFFGRDALVQQLLGRLAETDDLARFLAVVGPSGCGKSSAVKAGLIPALRRGGLPGSEKWFIVELMPGAHPLEELEAALLRIAVNPPESLLSQLREDKRGLLRAVRRCLPDDPEVELLMVIDQFEELFTLVPEEAERAHLLDSLVTAELDERSRLRLVVTLRADFIDRPLNYVDFGEVLRQRMELVLPFTPDELERAILGPAERLGLEWEPGLVAEISHDVGDQPGALPLLQYALTSLFERREGHRLTRTAYQALGGVLGALGGRAEQVYRCLTPPAQPLARQVFLRLATLGEGVGDGTQSPDTRRRVLRAELEALSGASPAEVINAYGQQRLLAFDRDPVTRGPTVEVAHEALLREWPRLRDWLSISRADVRLQRQLAAAAAEWENAQRDPGYLLAGPRLAQFEGWAGGTDVALTQAERTYLDAGLAQRQTEAAAEAERQRRELEAAKKLAESEKQRAEEQTRAAVRLRSRNRVITAIGIVTLAVAIVAVFFGAIANASSIRARILADANLNNFLSAKAYSLVSESSGNAELGALLSIYALNKGYNAEADVALTRALPKLLTRKIIHAGPNGTGGVAFSPDGSLVAVTLSTSQVQLYDSSSGELLRTVGNEGLTRWSSASPVVFSRDGKLILGGGGYGHLQVWETASGKWVQTFYLQSGQPVCAAAFSPDARLIAAATKLGDRVHLWDMDTGREIQTFTVSQPLFCGLVFSPDGKYVLTSSSDRGAILWEAATGQYIRDFKDPSALSGLINDVAFSPDGKRVLTGGQDRIARLWNTDSGQLLQSFSGHQDSVISVAFSPNGQSILTGSWDTSARLWDAATGQQKVVFSGSDNMVADVAFSPDGRSVLTGSPDGTMRLWRIPKSGIAQDDAAARYFPGIFDDARFSPDPQGRLMLFLYYDGIQNKQTLELWDGKTGQFVRSYDASNSVGDSYSLDGKSILTYGINGPVHLWDAASGQLKQTFSLPTSVMWDAVFSPDGGFVATGGSAYDLWDAGTGKLVYSLEKTGAADGQVVYSPDGKYLLTSDSSITLWSLADHARVRVFPYADKKNTSVATGVTSITFSPDSRYVLAGSTDNTARMWETATGNLVRIFSGHTAEVWSVAFSPDGHYVLTASNDKTARLWETATGTIVRILGGNQDKLYGASFSPDGKWILTYSDEGVRLWDTDFHDTIRAACDQLQRDLMPEERARFGITDTQPTCPVK